MHLFGATSIKVLQLDLHKSRTDYNEGNFAIR